MVRGEHQALRTEGGFGLLEAIIGAAILGISVVGALLIMNIMISQSAESHRAMNTSVIQSTIMSNLQNDEAWMHTVTDTAHNPTMACLKNFTDCAGVTETPFQVYQADGSVFYNSVNATAGFDKEGNICNSFSGTVSSEECPIRLDLTWKPLCANTPCINPTVLLKGVFRFTVATNGAAPVKSRRFQFSLWRSKLYGEPQLISNALAVAVPPANCGTGFAVATSSGASVVGACQNTVSLQPGSTYAVAFQYLPRYAVGYSAADANDTARICFYATGGHPVTGPCVYEWVEAHNSWLLKANGVQVYASSPLQKFASGLEFMFRLRNGTMAFYYRGVRTHVFDEISTRPLRASFRPGSLSYSPGGFNNVSFSFE